MDVFFISVCDVNEQRAIRTLWGTASRAGCPKRSGRSGRILSHQAWQRRPKWASYTSINTFLQLLWQKKEEEKKRESLLCVVCVLLNCLVFFVFFWRDAHVHGQDRTFRGLKAWCRDDSIWIQDLASRWNHPPRSWMESQCRIYTSPEKCQLRLEEQLFFVRQTICIRLVEL